MLAGMLSGTPHTKCNSQTRRTLAFAGQLTQITDLQETTLIRRLQTFRNCMEIRECAVT
jgi:hypothetical protein